MYIGIDVSKEHLDVSSHDGELTGRWTNDEQGLAELTEKLKDARPKLVVMEATGGYELEVTFALAASKVPLVVVNPRQVRDFAKALGHLAKTDKIDARVIAEFGNATKPEADPLPDVQTIELEALLTRRRQLVGMIATEKNRLASLFGPAKQSWAEKSIRDTLSHLIKQLSQLDKDLHKRLEKSPLWKAKDDLLKSVPGVGKVTAFTLWIDLPELVTGVFQRRLRFTFFWRMIRKDEVYRTVPHHFSDSIAIQAKRSFAVDRDSEN